MKNDFENAKSHYLATLRADPNRATGYNNLGLVFLRQGQISQAITQFNEALRVKPDDSEPRKIFASRARRIRASSLAQIEENCAPQSISISMARGLARTCHLRQSMSEDGDLGFVFLPHRG